MKRLSLIFALVFFVGSLIYAQEKFTEEQALELIDGYKARESAANSKVSAEQSKIDALESDIVMLDAQIAELQSKLKELNPPMEKAEAKAEKAEWKGEYYTVKRGDWLSKLAEYPGVYGKGNYAKWRLIYNANKELVKDPDLIYPGWKLRIQRP